MDSTKPYFGLTVEDVDICLYHGEGCPDGIGGAFPFFLYNRNKCTLVPCIHTDQIPHSLEGKVVVAVDFSFPVNITRSICAKAKYFVVLDHHATAERNLTGLKGTEGFENFDYIFDMNRSGAQIAWDWVHRKGAGHDIALQNAAEQNAMISQGAIEKSVEYPWFIQVIAARDLWRWDIFENSKALGKALHHKGYYTWENMEKLLCMTPTETTEVIKQLSAIGSPMVLSENREIGRAIDHSVLTEFEGYRVRLSHCQSHIRSEVGNSLCGKEDCLFSATWRYDFLSDQWWVSLRGDDNTVSHVDLSILVSKYGGGGHAKACGFAIHGPHSSSYLNADTKKRSHMAHGNLHDYFKVIPS